MLYDTSNYDHNHNDNSNKKRNKISYFKEDIKWLKIRRIKRQVNPNNNRVAVSEPVFDYALENVGYQIMDKHFEKAVEDGNDPSPKDIEEIQQAIINHQIAFFVDNSQTSDKVVDNLVKLAHEHNVPVLKVTETKPNGYDYMQWMLKQYQALSRIQQKEN